MRLIGRALRIFILSIVTLLGALCAVSVVTYAMYGRVFQKTTKAAVSYTTFFFGLAYAIWRFCGGKRQMELGGESSR